MKRGMFDRVRRVLLREVIDVDGREIAPESTFDALEMDSLDRVQVVMGIEEEFGIDIDDAEWENVRSVADILALLDRQPALR